MQPPSRNQVKKAASRLRQYHRNEATYEQYESAIKTIEAYRAQFVRPMNTINMGLRRHVGRAEVSARITQRLKKIPTIIEKLVFREPSLNLNTMHDIGGCRAVVPDLDALERLVSVIVERRADQILKHRNYIDSPRISGYRAHHLIVESNGLPVEIQLRTVSMHKWAETVEGFSDTLAINLKQDEAGVLTPDGSVVMIEFLKVIAEILWLRETASLVPPELKDSYSGLLIEVKNFIREREASMPGQGRLPI